SRAAIRTPIGWSGELRPGQRDRSVALVAAPSRAYSPTRVPQRCSVRQVYRSGRAASRRRSVAAGASPTVALALALLLVAGRLGASAARRLGQPSVLGELLVGIVLGNLPAIGVTGLRPLIDSPGVALLAQLGAVLLLFEIGLEQRLKDMRRL